MFRTVLTLACVVMCLALAGCGKHHSGSSSSVELIAPTDGLAKASSLFG